MRFRLSQFNCKWTFSMHIYNLYYPRLKDMLQNILWLDYINLRAHNCWRKDARARSNSVQIREHTERTMMRPTQMFGKTEWIYTRRCVCARNICVCVCVEMREILARVYLVSCITFSSMCCCWRYWVGLPSVRGRRLANSRRGKVVCPLSSRFPAHFSDILSKLFSPLLQTGGSR